MQHLEPIQNRNDNPVDIVELVATTNNWSFERSCEDEISILTSGKWADYDLSLSWLSEIEGLHLACSFDQKISGKRDAEISKLISLINEQLLVGHFEIWHENNLVMFRSTQLYCGGVTPNNAQITQLLDSALDACERYYQAFQFTLWSTMDPHTALNCANFDTVGTA